MRAFIPSHRPRPATLIAMAALVFATTGVAAAKPIASQGEVSLITLSGGPVDTTTPNADVSIPLNGEPSFTFVQMAGEAVELIATVNADQGTSNFCGLTTIVYADGAPLGARIDLHTNKGELGDGSAIGGLAPPAADTTITLRAIAREQSGCDEAVEGEEEESIDDTWTVLVTVAVIALRD